MSDKKRSYSKLTKTEQCVINTHVDEAFKDSPLAQDAFKMSARDTVLDTIGIDQLIANMRADSSKPLFLVPSVCSLKNLLGWT